MCSIYFRCQRVNYNKKDLAENGQLLKIDFIWVNHDHKSFEWLLNLLRQFEEEQETYSTSNLGENRFLDIHLFFTQIKNDENIGNVPLDVVTKTWAQVAGNDIFTSLRTKTQIGRSNWTELFDRLISNENASTADDVNVFFRGSPIMGNSIREHCEKFRFHFFKEF
ncbi:unnamed protein product [Rotaria socialis]|uniref:Ferric reductase NAD binding domain-containing protein n=1 Tax=Rotaria socialis TaxID=392032 RepID=A0A818ATL3_9BILA|nr:unnamed protein product [Rotaria socialis]